nr:MAG TPA: hypothetical protein [Bacteriophage sp.]
MIALAAFYNRRNQTPSIIIPALVLNLQRHSRWVVFRLHNAPILETARFSYFITAHIRHVVSSLISVIDFCLHSLDDCRLYAVSYRPFHCFADRLIECRVEPVHKTFNRHICLLNVKNAPIRHVLNDGLAHSPERISPLRATVCLGRSDLDFAGILECGFTCRIADFNGEIASGRACGNKAGLLADSRTGRSASRGIGERRSIALDELAILHGETRLHLVGGRGRERNAADAGNNALNFFLSRAARLVDVVRKVAACTCAFVAAIGDNIGVIGDCLARQGRSIVAGLIAGNTAVRAKLQRRDDDVQRTDASALVLCGAGSSGEDRNRRDEVNDLRVHRRGDGRDLSSGLVDEVEDLVSLAGRRGEAGNCTGGGVQVVGHAASRDGRRSADFLHVAEDLGEALLCDRRTLGDVDGKRRAGSSNGLANHDRSVVTEHRAHLGSLGPQVEVGSRKLDVDRSVRRKRGSDSVAEAGADFTDGDARRHVTGLELLGEVKDLAGSLIGTNRFANAFCVKAGISKTNHSFVTPLCVSKRCLCVSGGLVSCILDSPHTGSTGERGHINQSAAVVDLTVVQRARVRISMLPFRALRLCNAANDVPNKPLHCIAPQQKFQNRPIFHFRFVSP